MQNKTTNVLLAIIALALIVLVGVFIFKKSAPAVAPAYDQSYLNDQSNTIPTIPQQSTQNVPAQGTVPPSQPVSPANVPAAGMTRYTDPSFGFSFDYPNADSIAMGATTSTMDVKVIDIDEPNSNGFPSASITERNGSSAGSYAGSISWSSNGWMAVMVNEQNGNFSSQPVAPIAYTDSGLPIFNGMLGSTHQSHGFGQYTYTVTLSHTKFLNITGDDGSESSSGYNAAIDPTLNLAKTVQVQ